jgi:hypothetical protein
MIAQLQQAGAILTGKTNLLTVVEAGLRGKDDKIQLQGEGTLTPPDHPSFEMAAPSRACAGSARRWRSTHPWER